MRAILLFITGMILTFPVCSQVNHPIPQDTTSEWKIWIGQWDPLNSWYSGSDCRVFVSGDTTVDGNVYSRLLCSGMHSITYQGVTNSWPFENSFYAFIRTDSARTFLLLGDQEELLYDFTLQAGDTLPATIINWNTVVVSSVDSVLVNGKHLRRFNIYDSVNQDLMSTWYIEGIGHEYGLVEPMYMMLDNGNFLECYAEQHVPVYPEGVACDLTVNLPGEIPYRVTFRVYPNPSEGPVTLEIFSEQPGKIRLLITGTVGNILIDEHWELTAGLNEIFLDLSVLGPGLYLIAIVDSFSLSKNKLIIME